jgi:hypothetical protein
MTEFREVRGDETGLLASLATLHCACLPASAITKLGPGYAVHFYRMLARSASDHVLAAIDEGTTKGGLVLSERPGVLTRRMLTRTPLILYLIARLRSVTLPMLTGSPASVASPPLGEPVISPQGLERIETMPELVHLFVAPASRGEGLGEALVARCTALCRNEGVPSYFVKTRTEDGNRAVQFYERLGFKKLGIVEKQGRQFVGFVRDMT